MEVEAEPAILVMEGALLVLTLQQEVMIKRTVLPEVQVMMPLQLEDMGEEEVAVMMMAAAAVDIMGPEEEMMFLVAVVAVPIVPAHKQAQHKQIIVMVMLI